MFYSRQKSHIKDRFSSMGGASVRSISAFCKVGISWILGALFILMASGCSKLQTERDYATPRFHHPFKFSTWFYYIPNRVFDVLDIPVAGVQVGPGLNARFQITDLFGISLPTNSCGPEIGLNTHWIDPIRNKDTAYFWKRYRPFAMGCHGGPSMPIPFLKMNLGEIRSSPDAIDVGAHALLVGAHVGIRPVDLVDLVTGFILLDINRDDLTWKSYKKSEEEEEDEKDE